VLQEAREIYDHPDLTYNIGRAYTRLRRCDEARRAFITYLQRPEITKADDEKARQNLKELSSCVPPARLAVECSPETAMVSVDGEPSKACPTEFEVEPDEQHRIVVTAREYETAEETRTPASGETVAVEIELQKPEKEIPPPTEPAGDGSWKPIVGWSAIGAGAAMLIGGVVLDSTSSGRAQRLQQAAADGDDSRVQELEKGGRTARAATIGLYIGGLVAAATGTALVIWASSGKSGEKAAGATVSLRF
jgi:hypothetical protein